MENSKKYTESDLLGLVNGKIEEGYSLEYKRSDALDLRQDKCKSEISKDVSALCNASGGVIIYGIVEENHKPSKLDAGVDPSIVTKEQIENVLSGNIRPRIPDLHILPVPLNKSSPGKVAYVITVPKGITAHQASDYKYYRRRNFKVEPMLDEEVRDVMHRVQHPTIEPRFRYLQANRSAEQHQYQLLISLENTGQICCFNTKFEFQFPNNFILSNDHRLDRHQSVQLKASARTALTYFSKSRYNMAFFPGESWYIPEVNIPAITYKIDDQLYRELQNVKPVIPWRLFADNAPYQEGEIELSTLQNF